ncbi:MAG: tRNA lysidine(34) synthetase TilS [Pseudomonadota bacterium]
MIVAGSEPVLEAVRAAVLGLAVRPGRLLVGLSGGVDSMALLLATRIVARETEPPLSTVALHAHHGLQTQADQWAAFCGDVCAALEVPLVVGRLQVPPTGNLEQAARTARYKFFLEQAQPEDLTLLAHHADDQTETLLLRLLQGRSLAAMSELGSVQGLAVLRPLLGLTKRDLQAFVEQQDQTWVFDPSNAERALDRNFLRHEILPQLRQRWQNLDVRVQRLGRYVAALEKQCQAELAERFAAGQPLLVTELSGDSEVALFKLRCWLALHEEFTVTDRALREFLRQCFAGKDARIQCTGARELCLDGRAVVVT